MQALFTGEEEDNKDCPTSFTKLSGMVEKQELPQLLLSHGQKPVHWSEKWHAANGCLHHSHDLKQQGRR